MPENLPDILTGITRKDLFEKFRLQLRKDFESCALQGSFCDELQQNYEMIKQVILTEIEKTGRIAGGRLQELLYRIDISEMQIKNAYIKSPELKMEEVIADLIIKRELQKIVFKEFYGKHE